ncbi:MAG: TIGR01777 family oxidoreductase [Cryomorphaceae bacterium]|nr:TIGR01777 family oxidoreductase [Cryomorphaceae bacterium]
MNSSKMILAGGTGFLGQVLLAYFKPRFQSIVVLTRGSNRFHENVQYVRWDAENLGAWQNELENAAVLINLTGKSVNCRYTAKNKSMILASRINSTRVLNQAVLRCHTPPRHFINSSTATIYRDAYDKKMDEYTGEIGHDFSMDVAKRWEAEFFGTDTPKTRKTAIRTSIVLGKNGGAFLPLKRITALGLGGKQGSGKQFVSWIHSLDFARALDFILEKELEGVINVTAPNPITNANFMAVLRKAMGMPLGLNAPKALLEIGTFFLQTETELVLKSRNVIPKRLLEAGFVFQYEEAGMAVREIVGE